MPFARAPNQVDDLFMVGGAVHRAKLAQLRSKFTFGKWVKLKATESGCGFNGRRVKQKPNGEFLVDMQKFVDERLKGVTLEKGRASEKKESASPAEVEAARATCGALNWLSTEGRRILSSRLRSLTVEDICQLNDAVKKIKENSALAFEANEAGRGDGCWGNAGFHSQGGHIIIAHEAELGQTGQAVANVVTWRSGKLQRVVNSTLAAGTQSLSRGLRDLLWAMVVLEEFLDGKFRLRSWPERLSALEVLALAPCHSDGALKGALAVVDAKSLYDQLAIRSRLGGTAIEIQIIRKDLLSLGGKIRWVDHHSMLADGLTKLKGSNEALYRMLASGIFRIQAEEAHLKAREEAKGQVSGAEPGAIETVWNQRERWVCQSGCYDRLLMIPDGQLGSRGPLASTVLSLRRWAVSLGEKRTAALSATVFHRWIVAGHIQRLPKLREHHLAAAGPAPTSDVSYGSTRRSGH